MSYTFIAYIDESGDEGFQILEPPKRGSSEWFFISAVLARRTDARHILRRVNRFNAMRSQNAKGHFHFSEASHADCIGYVYAIQHSPVTLITVAIHKTRIPKGTALRAERHYLFNWATRLLLERISWFCDESKKVNEAGRVHIIFSSRRQLKLPRLLAYFATLRKQSTQIRWAVIDETEIEVAPNEKFIGLQMADAVASGTARALEYNRHSQTEHRFAKMLKDRYWRRSGKCLSYGLKFVPDLEDDPFGDSRFHWVHHFE